MNIRTATIAVFAVLVVVTTGLLLARRPTETAVATPAAVASPPPATSTISPPPATAALATSPTAAMTAAPDETTQPASLPEASADLVIYDYRVVNIHPHDPNAFTQGLVYIDDELYEGTGLYGRSSLRKVELETGRVLQQHDLDAAYFGEGIAVIDDRIFQLTWQNGVGFVYDRGTFAELAQFEYATEGWGLTYDGEHLIMSDGTPTIYFLDPETLQAVRSITVTVEGQRLPRLNELEYVDGKILANVWQTDVFVRIDPATGAVDGLADLSGLLAQAPAFDGAVDVLNGIAYDAEGDRLFVTGKLWPYLFEIELQPRP
jgi:glutamine cyclotransferase